MELQTTIISILICLLFFAVTSWLLARSGTLERRLALALFVLSVPVFTYAYLANLGHAMPYYPPILDIPETYQDVRDFKVIKEVGIYFLLDDPDNRNAAPILIFKPWDSLEARRLQNSVSDDNGNGTLKFDSQGGFKGFRMQKKEVIEKEVPVEHLMELQQHTSP